MNFDRVAKSLENYVNHSEIAGAAVRVRVGSKIELDYTAGFADIENRIPVKANTVFRLCSMSKPVTGVLAMTLVEQGLLELDAPVYRYLPEFSHLPALTVRMLMDHSCGILEAPDHAPYTPDVHDTLAEHIRKMAKVPVDFEPGTSTGYSGAGGLDVVGRIIEVVSGDPFDVYLKKVLTDPLGMKDTVFILNDEQRSRLCKLYEYTDSGTLELLPDEKEMHASINPFSGSAALYGTLEDYDRMVQMLRAEGTLDGQRILKPETVRKMYEPSAANGLELCPGCIWGISMLLFRDNQKSGRSLFDGTYGWSGAYGTHFFISPAQNLQAVLMVNRSNINGAGSYVSIHMEEDIYQCMCENS